MLRQAFSKQRPRAGVPAGPIDMPCHTHLFRSHHDALLVAPLCVSPIVVPGLLAHVERVCACPGGSLVVDLTSTTRVDRCVLPWLVWADGCARRRGGRLAVVLPAPGVLDPVGLLVVTGPLGEGAW